MIRRAARIARMMPSVAAGGASIRLSITKILRMEVRVAPIAMRMPISFVLLLIIIIIVLAMPKPAMINIMI